MRLVGIDVNGMIHAFGIDDATPVFHYIAESERTGAAITAYQCIVKKNEDAVWDSGKVTYPGSNYIAYEGTALESRTEYNVEIKIWDEQDICAKQGASVTFETGLLNTEFNAQWIEPVQEDAIEEKQLSFMEMIIPNPEFWGGEARLRECKQIRREVSIEKEIKRARIYATAHGVYNLYCNGKKVSNRRLAPEISVYPGQLYYQTYDVTKALQQGDNCIGVVLADGWWIGRFGLAGDSCNYGNRLGFLMQMEIEYTDGSKEVICSDEQFKGTGSYIRYSDLSIGEKQDLTMKDDSWMLPGFADEAWEYCSVAEYGKENLNAQPIDPVTVIETLEAKDIFYTPKNELVIDFGQVIAGVGHFEIETDCDCEITFEHGEILDAEGNYTNNILGRNKDQKDVLICDAGLHTFEPQFTFHGFRYVRVTGVSKEQITCATALVMGTPLKQTGEFSCSNPDLNQLQHNIQWSTLGNMLSIPTDCPQREKMGWTGDIQVYTNTGCFNYDLYNFLRTWLMNVRLEQTPEGEIPVVIPNMPKQERTQRIMSAGSNSSAVWGDACVMVPYYLYECYGNKQILEENFEMMQKWLGYIASNCAKEPEGYEHFTEAQKSRNPYLWTKQYHFGDWLIPSLRALPDGVQRGTTETAAVVGSSYYAVTVAHFIKVCEALGKDQLAEEYKELLAKIKWAVSEEFVAEDGTVNNSNLQGLYVIVLKSEVVEGELKQKVLEKLVSLIRENGNRLDTGFASVSYLLDMLYENGYPEVAYDILYQTKAPSWLYMVKNGATTMWENWLAVKEDGTITDSSYNHYAFGCVGDFMYRRLGGIKKGAPGYETILFEPDLSCGLTECNSSIMTPYGKASLHWKLVDEKCQIQIEVPVGAKAVLSVPGTSVNLESGRFSYEITWG